MIVSFDTIINLIPPYHITSEILNLITSISEKLGAVSALNMERPSATLRKKNRIKTLHSSLAIEGNTLTNSQITALIEDKRVLGPTKDILEVNNAIEVYGQLDSFNPLSLADLLSAHKMMMKGLIKSAGKFRTGQVGIVKGSKVAHLAPPGSLVNGLTKDLISYLKTHNDPELIKSCVFHYELEFIHPFEDGNGRMGRLWQTLILKEKNPVFEYLPIEHLIKSRQEDYYKSLSMADKAGNASPFITFMLHIIDLALNELLQQQTPHHTAQNRLEIFRRTQKTSSFSRKDYLRAFKTISTATASRDLKLAVEQGLIIKSGDKRLTSYSFNPKHPT